MALYKSIFPTKWPLLDFHLSVWRLEIATRAMMESPESLTYEYIRLAVFWRKKEVFHIRLFDTEKRAHCRLSGMLEESQEITLKKLEEIVRVANEELVKIKKIKK